MDTKFKKGHIMSAEIRDKISKKLKGIKRSPDTLAKMKISGKLNNSKISAEGRKSQADKLRGRKYTEERLKKCKERLKIKENHPNWKGGITPVVMQIRNSLRMRQWVSDIFHQDDFTCQHCLNRGGKLNAHHLKSFSLIFRDNNIKTLQDALDCEEFWDLNNGQTLCVDCHKKINTRRDG